MPNKNNTSLSQSICTTQVSAIPYNAAASACEKAAEWKNALHVVMEVQNLFEIGTIITYGSGISACEKSLEWQRSLQLLKELPEKSLEGILGKNTPFLFVSAQWLGNISVITTNLLLKYGRLRLIWADFS